MDFFSFQALLRAFSFFQVEASKLPVQNSTAVKGRPEGKIFFTGTFCGVKTPKTRKRKARQKGRISAGLIIEGGSGRVARWEFRRAV